MGSSTVERRDRAYGAIDPLNFTGPQHSAGPSLRAFAAENYRASGGPGVSDTEPGVRPASRPCVRERSAVSLVALGPAIVVAAARGRRV